MASLKSAFAGVASSTLGTVTRSRSSMEAASWKFAGAAVSLQEAEHALNMAIGRARGEWHEDAARAEEEAFDALVRTRTLVDRAIRLAATAEEKA